MLKKTSVAISTLFLVGACLPVEFWYKPGVVPQQPIIELTDCQVRAARDVPAQLMTGQTPTYVTPVQTSCTGSGQGRYNPYGYTSNSNVSCTQTGGQVSGGRLYTYDGNANLRGQVAVQCMSQKGYQYISVRKCENKDLPQSLPSYKTLPKLQSNSCAFQIPDGNYIFVNPS